MTEPKKETTLERLAAQGRLARQPRKPLSTLPPPLPAAKPGEPTLTEMLAAERAERL